MVKSRAELFAEINVTPPAKDSDNESVEGKEDTPERETKVGEKEEQLQAEKPPKKKRKTKKKDDANKENRPAVKDKLATVIGVGKAPRLPLSPVGNIPLPTTASTPAMEENLHPTIPSTPNASNNLPGRVNTISEDLAPLTTTPNFSNTLCGVQNIAHGGITNTSQDMIVPSTPDVSNCTLLDLDSIVSEDLAPLG
ncbi:Hypothetical predicted protein [Paramuricea clavata]|uniref:Uncharacterized protein n=1 Tax=Paramuricea clavata TaxID=317549 RepID=A0A7D9IGR1_PARCT|nr:Hypothetical predicted protein [Paramuricea clavata]